MADKSSTKLISRQMRKLGIADGQAPTLEQWRQFLKVIESTYDHSDESRYLLERSLQISADEMRAAYYKQKETSLELAQTSKLASLGTLASGIAHELNNPLCAIKAYAEILQNNGRINNEDLKKIERIVVMCDRMGGIIHHLLKLARKPTGEDKSVVGLKDIVNDALTLSRNQMVFDHIDVKVNVSHKNTLVVGDTHRLGSVIQNIINNARDEFMRADQAREVKDTIAIEEVSGDDRSQFVLLKVTDNAGGISPNIMGQIFDPFFTTKESGKGTGLGLTLAKKIMNELGGDLSVSSEGGETHFLLKLKRADFNIESTSTKSDSIEQRSSANRKNTIAKKKILFVDDEPDLVFLMKERLSDVYDVTAVESAVEAVANLNANKYDVLISDLRMPNLSGESLAELAMNINENIGICIFSGHADAANEVRDREDFKNVVFISKPMPSQANLISLIEKSMALTKGAQ